MKRTPELGKARHMGRGLLVGRGAGEPSRPLERNDSNSSCPGLQGPSLPLGEIRKHLGPAGHNLDDGPDSIAGLRIVEGKNLVVLLVVHTDGKLGANQGRGTPVWQLEHCRLEEALCDEHGILGRGRINLDLGDHVGQGPEPDRKFGHLGSLSLLLSAQGPPGPAAIGARSGEGEFFSSNVAMAAWGSRTGPDVCQTTSASTEGTNIQS